MTTSEWPLEGVWIMAVATPLGNVILKCVCAAQDAAKTCFSGELDYINHMPVLVDVYPDAEATKSGGGQMVKVGRNEYEGTFLEYHTKTTGQAEQEIVGVDTVNTTFEIIGPNLIRGQGTGSYYMAAQDVDKDGFPDEGQEPVVHLPWRWTAKRLTMMP
jgi:hypothetical protein